MPDYKQSKIYTITFEDGAIYVGSTTNTLKERLRGHRRYKKSSVYKYVHNFFENDWSKCKIELYENYPCNNKKELDRKEGEVIRLIGTINKYIAGRCHKEYDKEYREKNREKIARRHSKYGKEYRKNKKEIIAEKKKEYYEENKENILQKVECDCGCIVNKSSLARHLKTQRHKDLMEKLITAILSFLSFFESI